MSRISLFIYVLIGIFKLNFICFLFQTNITNNNKYLQHIHSIIYHY
jgi:hypothetical protein